MKIVLIVIKLLKNSKYKFLIEFFSYMVLLVGLIFNIQLSNTIKSNYLSEFNYGVFTTKEDYDYKLINQEDANEIESLYNVFIADGYSERLIGEEKINISHYSKKTPLIEGKYPTKENEVIYARSDVNLNKKYNIGDTFIMEEEEYKIT